MGKAGEWRKQYLLVKQPVYINQNCYMKGAKNFEREQEFEMSEADPMVRVIEEEDTTYLEITATKEMLRAWPHELRSGTFGMPRITEAAYETPDGREIVFDTDYCGKNWDYHVTAGPFAGLKEGVNRIKVWG